MASTNSQPVAPLVMIYTGVNIQSIDRDPNNGRNVVSVGLVTMDDSGNELHRRKFSFAFTADEVHPKRREWLNGQPDVLDRWLADSRASFNEIASGRRESFPSEPNFDNPIHRDIVNRIVRQQLTDYLRELELTYSKLNGYSAYRLVSDAPQYHVARIEPLVFPTRGTQMMYQAYPDFSKPEGYSSEYTACAINPDTEYRAWLGEPDRQWSFGSELAKRLGVTLESAEIAFDSLSSARMVVANYITLSNAMKPRVRAMWA